MRVLDGRGFGGLAVVSLLVSACIGKPGEPKPEPASTVEAPVAGVIESGVPSPIYAPMLPPLASHPCDPLTDAVPRLRVGADGEPVGDPRPLELLAELTDGRWLLVTDPAPGEREGRVFFGPPAAVLERGLWDTARPKGPGPKSVRFEVGGTLAHAQFPRPCGTPAQPGRTGRYGTDCPGDLYLDGEPVRFERRALDQLPGKTFLCGTQKVRVSVDEALRRAEQWLDDPRPSCSPDHLQDPAIEFHQLRCRSADTDERLVRVDTRTGEVMDVET